MSLIEHIDIPNHLWIGIYQTGSSVICDPPVIDTDIDYIINTDRDRFMDLVDFLVKSDFKISSEDHEEYDLLEETFSCLRKGNINLILTTDRDFYLKFVTATKLAKKMNLLNKDQRISLFQYVLYGNI